MASLRGRRLKGKGKGVLGARETRATLANVWPISAFSKKKKTNLTIRS